MEPQITLEIKFTYENHQDAKEAATVLATIGINAHRRDYWDQTVTITLQSKDNKQC